MAERSTRLVTPEAVVLEVEAAGLASRTLAALLDLLVLWFAASSIFGLLGSLGGPIGEDLGQTAEIVVVVAALVLWFGFLLAWPVAWEVLTRGRSVGKMALGLRVVTVEGAPIRFRHALIRGLVGLVELTLTGGAVGLAVALASRRFRRLGDHLAGTVVVRDRQALGISGRAVRFVPHPAWAGWAERLDATRLTPDDHRLVRGYLLRASQLEPSVRADLGARLLTHVGGRLGLRPEAITAALAWGPVPPLTAVAAAYQRRFDATAGTAGTGGGPWWGARAA